MFESAVAKYLFYFGMSGLGYLGLSKFCENAGVQEPLAATARGAISFAKNLRSEFAGANEDQRALAEMAARKAYAEVLAANTQPGTPYKGTTPVTK